jgi:zinc D-Ala-D-Ala dipeptidase
MYKKLLVCLLIIFGNCLIQAAPQLVELIKINPRIRVQLVYATPHNFTGKIIYKKCAKAYLLKEVAQALSDVQKELEPLGFGLLVWDAYRPMQGQQALWDAYPDERFVLPPQKGGRHTRGTTVDLTLVRLFDGIPLEMPTGFDSFTPQAASDCANVSPEALKNRTLLQNVMKKHGFMPIASEWWHFDFKNWRDYLPLAIDFDDLLFKKKKLC